MRLIVRAVQKLLEEESASFNRADPRRPWFELALRFRPRPAGFDVDSPRVVELPVQLGDDGQPEAPVGPGSGGGRVVFGEATAPPTPKEMAAGIAAVKEQLARKTTGAVLGLFSAAAEVLLTRGDVSADDLRDGLQAAIDAQQGVGRA